MESQIKVLTIVFTGFYHCRVGNLFFIVGRVCRIGWHIWQTRFENRTYRDDLKHLIKQKP